MKKIVLLMLLCFHMLKLEAQPTLDYSNYTLAFADFFDIYNPNTFKTDPAFTAKWRIDYATDVCDGSAGFGWNWDDEDYMSLYKVGGNGIIKLREVAVPRVFCTDTNIKRNHISASLRSRNRVASIGIIEARIKLPPTQNPLSHSATPAFWLAPLGADTEIDIIDNHEGTPQGAIKSKIFAYHWKGSAPPQYIEKETANLDLSGFHVFSGLWTPARLTIYMDGNYLTHIDYAEGSNSNECPTYVGFLPIIISLQTVENTISNLEMEIDWVKYWKPNCTDGSFVVNSSNHHSSIMDYPALPPSHAKAPQFNLLKYRDIYIEDPSTTIHSQSDLGTIIEAESTTILPNFLADESIPVWQSVPTGYGNVDMKVNGYLEIKSMICSQEPWEPEYMNDGNSLYHVSSQDYSFKPNNTPDGSSLSIQPTDTRPLGVKSIYPNPTTGNFTVMMQKAVDGELTITNSIGTVVYKLAINAASGRHINIDTHLPAGNYIVNVRAQDTNYNEKLVIIQ